MNVREVIKRMVHNGWARKKGSHRQYTHPYAKGVVTISGHLNDDSAKGALNSSLKQAGLKVVEKDV
jgi:Predicted periplasmic or secreted lipoprotein